MTTVDVTYNKTISDEYDLSGCSCYFGTHGGLAAATGHFSNGKIRNYYGDTREQKAVAVRGLGEEIRRVVRAKLLNPQWIEGMKKHGYKGAGDIFKRVGNVFGWEASTREVDDWIFDDIARTFMLDENNRAFFEKHNLWALEEISRRLLEAESRGLWQADAEVLQNLKTAYLHLEGVLEEHTEAFGGKMRRVVASTSSASTIWSTGKRRSGPSDPAKRFDRCRGDSASAVETESFTEVVNDLSFWRCQS